MLGGTSGGLTRVHHVHDKASVPMGGLGQKPEVSRDASLLHGVGPAEGLGQQVKVIQLDAKVAQRCRDVCVLPLWAKQQVDVALRQTRR